MPIQRFIVNATLAIGLSISLAGCAHKYVVVDSGNSKDSSEAINKLNEIINKSVLAGCDVKNVTLGIGHGLGVGINIGNECKDCDKDKITNTVERSTIVAAALLRCPIKAAP